METGKYAPWYYLWSGSYHFQQEEGWEALWKPNKGTREMIGVVSATLVQGFSYFEGEEVSALTVVHPTTDDWDDYPDRVRIQLRNDNATTFSLSGLAVRGKPVVRFSGEEGPVNDKYVDYERMGKEGEKLLEIGNNYVCSQARVNQIADWFWKYNRVKKHVYTVTVPGFCAFYEIGEWYTLVVTSAAAQGALEVINSTVECISVECRQDAGDIGQTTVAFREVQTNWNYDSVEYARFLAIGRYGRREEGRVLTVAGSRWTGHADYYCDGTDDQEEFNTAFDYLRTVGGGNIRQVGGPFYISSSIVPCSNLVWDGDSQSTIIASGEFDAISVVGSATNILDNIVLNDLSLERTDDAASAAMVGMGYVSNLTANRTKIRNSSHAAFYNYFGQPIEAVISESDISGVSDSYASGSLCYSFYINSASRVRIERNRIHEITRSGRFEAIVVGQWCPEATIESNRIWDIQGASGYWCRGILSGASQTAVVGNFIDNIHSSNPAAVEAIDIFGSNSRVIQNTIVNSDRGIVIGVCSKVKVTNNYCFNNGSATDIVNTSGHHFVDSGTSTMIAVNSWQ